MTFTHKLISTFILVVLFTKSFAQTTDSLAMAQVAQKMIFPVTITKGQKMLPPIVSPPGYRVDLKGSDHLPVIALDGKITEPLTDVNVNLFYQLTNQSNLVIIDLPTVRLLIPGKFVDHKSNNPKPFVIPALQEWHGGTGSFKIGKQSRIVIKDKNKDLAEVAALLKKDLLTYNYDLRIVTDNPKKGDVVLSLNNDDNSLGNEGYYLDIDQQINMTAFKKRGLIWATRTLLQLLEQAGTKADLPKGICRDYPKYEVRGLVLDVARKFFTIGFLRDYVKFMSYYKMSEFHIHLNDNGFPGFFNNDWNKVKAAFRLENST